MHQKRAVTPELKEYLLKAKPELLPVLTHMQEIGFTWDRERELWTFTGTGRAQNEQYVEILYLGTSKRITERDTRLKRGESIDRT
jgi:hypothetical protein